MIYEKCTGPLGARVFRAFSPLGPMDGPNLSVSPSLRGPMPRFCEGWSLKREPLHFCEGRVFSKICLSEPLFEGVFGLPFRDLSPISPFLKFESFVVLFLCFKTFYHSSSSSYFKEKAARQPAQQQTSRFRL
ncbi:hypothetical protein H5410_032813 [Solanum commersonii]|uniref:Uncharacterized protein n=1 Tax=Solanum commersonii TaxID=4109 RepID=A0A9J5YL07_SOLCO|nr:hypothetical protein H5410_032813 [Solanum commersonii]